jgi:hypothetical protein
MEMKHYCLVFLNLFNLKLQNSREMRVEFAQTIIEEEGAKGVRSGLAIPKV